MLVNLWWLEFKMAAIMKFESEWMSEENGWIQDGRIQDDCHHQVEWEWMSEVFLVQGVWIHVCRFQDASHYEVRVSFWVNLREDWTRYLNTRFVQNGWIQDGRIKDDRIQDGCHHQVKSEWMSLSQIQTEGRVFWVNLREDNKVSECKMADSKMAEFKMAAIIKLSQIELKFFLSQNGWIRVAGFKSVFASHQSESEWMSEVFFVQNGWIKGWQISR